MKLSRSTLIAVILAAAVGSAIALIVTNPGLPTHLTAMRHYAEVRPPYSITDSQLISAGFQYRDFILWSVVHRHGKACTIGYLGGVSPSAELQSVLIDVYFSKKSTGESAVPASVP